MAMTPDQARKVGAGVTPSPLPFYTPRPERRRIDPKSLDWNSNRLDREREVNVQVLLRCRPLNDDEKQSNMAGVISCNEQKKEVVVLQSVANKQIDRVFTFDKVFGPRAQQRAIYDQAVAPIVHEVLEGFNCTVFAYGQTGTGKTYTMEGERRNKKGGELSAEAGVIPRAVRQIFDTLETQNADYSMKVTFLEIYNEEITDLLAMEDCSRTMEDRQRRHVSLMEDGKGCVIVRGLEEESVYSANEIYNLLERGAAKQRTADTLLNKHSSRSHSVFSITVYIKEATVGDEDLIKCGKLNLVDLAGSENISRSGVRESRAREVGEINKSLLTLGRCINALVEHSVHVPYRDSKLTRLLRDSLGGKTKTCVVATISPSAHCLDETLSTLDYACRAKSIKNKPEANQKISRAVLLKDLYIEIEKMKQDVQAAREKNGVYIPHERYAQDEAEKKARNEKIEQLEIDLSVSMKEAEKFHMLYDTNQEEKLNIENELNDCKLKLERNRKTSQELQENHRVAVSTIKEKEFIITQLLNSENSLIECAKELRGNLKDASDDISSLFTKINDKDKLESRNHELVLTFGSQLDRSLKDLHKIIVGSVSEQQQHVKSMEEHVDSFIASKCDATHSLELRITKMMENYTSGLAVLKDHSSKLKTKACSDLEQINSTISSLTQTIEQFLENAVLDANEVVRGIKDTVNEQKQLLAASAQKQEDGLKRSLVAAQVISEGTVSFFNDLHRYASGVMMMIDESLMKKQQQLETFEKMFKEEASREEKVAVEKIASILTTLTLKRTSMVAEARRNIHDSHMWDGKKLKQEMSNIQQVSDNAKGELHKYMLKASSHFLEDAVSSAETEATVECGLEECLEKLNDSKQKWELTQSFINRLNKNNVADIQCTINGMIRANNDANEELVSETLSLNAGLDGRACGIMGAVKDSLMLDHETRKGLDTMSKISSHHLQSVLEMHGERVVDIRNKAERCLINDYLVDEPATARRRELEIPSVASIEGLGMAASEDLVGHYRSENKSKRCDGESQKKKIQPHQMRMSSPSRTPFADVN